MKQNIFIVFLVFTLQTFLIFSSDSYLELSREKLAGFVTTLQEDSYISSENLVSGEALEELELRLNSTNNEADADGAGDTNTNTSLRSFQCNICKKYCTKNWTLKEHIRTHTGAKPFKCSYCSKSFANNSNKIRHEKTHTGEKPYKCPHCSKGFSRKYDSTRHVNNCKLNPKNAITRGLGLKRSK